MADNLVKVPGLRQAVVCSHPAVPASGDPVRFGYRTGLALGDENSAGLTVVDFGSFVADLSVKGVDDVGNSAVSVGDALFYVDADTPKISKKSSGYFFGFAMDVVGSGLTATIEVAHCDTPGSGTLGAGTVGTANLANGAVTADKLGSDAVTTAKILNANVTTAKIADVNVTEGKIEVGAAGAGLSGLVAKFAADANVIGAIPVLHRIAVASGANGDVDVTLTHKTRVIDFWFVLKGAGTAGSAVTLKNGANAISDAIDASAGGDKDVFRAGELDDAQHEIAASGTLRITKASTGGDFPGAEAYVLGVRVA